MPNSISDSEAMLDICLTDAEFPALPNFQRGKVEIHTICPMDAG